MVKKSGKLSTKLSRPPLIFQNHVIPFITGHKKQIKYKTLKHFGIKTFIFMIVIFVSKIWLKVKGSCENCGGATQGEGKQKDAFATQLLLFC